MVPTSSYYLHQMPEVNTVCCVAADGTILLSLREENGGVFVLNTNPLEYGTKIPAKWTEVIESEFEIAKKITRPEFMEILQFVADSIKDTIAKLPE